MRPRTTPTLIAFACIAASALPFAACGNSSADTPDTTSTGGPDGGAISEGGVTPGNEAGADGPALGGGIQGTVLARSDHHAVASRTITVRDAKGKTQNATTDAAGAFSVTDVAPPYDLYVAPSGTSSNATSMVYLGVKATKLRIFGDTNDLPPPSSKNATVSISWTVPSCTGGACRTRIVVRTAGGTQLRAQHPGYGSGTAHTYDVPADWPEPDTTTSAQVAMLLTGTDGASHFFAQTTATLTAAQITQVNIAPTDLKSVPPLGSATFTATSSASGFNAPGGSVLLQLPAPGGAFELVTGSMPSPLSFDLPTLAGTSLSFRATQLSAGAPFNSVGAMQLGAAPAASMAYSLSLGDPFPIASPAEHGSVSLGTGSVEFHAGAEPRTHFVQWVRLDGGPGTYVILGDPKLTLSRLVGLGPAITPGPIQLIVEEHTRAMDDVLGDMTADAAEKFSSTSYEASFVP